MGNNVSSQVSGEVQDSLNQILYALNQEFPLQSQSPHHPSISQQTSIVEDKESPKHPHPSRLLDHYHPDGSQNIRKPKLTVIKRQWQCQFCHTKNESDAQICSECGSNKINVYIPVMDRTKNNKNQQISSPLIK
jgi:hypothetical protein